MAILFKQLFGLGDEELARVQDNIADAFRRVGPAIESNASSMTFGTDDPQDVGDVGGAVVGTSTGAAHSDHVHAHGSLATADPLHPLVTTLTNGFMLASDKLELDALPISMLSTDYPLSVGTATPGTGISAARWDHVHEHGSLAGGALHATASTTVDGFMSAADKVLVNKFGSYVETAISATISATTGTVVVTGNSDAVTLTMPTATLATIGRRITIIDGDGTSDVWNITVNRAGSDTILGDTSVVLANQFGAITMVSNGSNKWFII